MNMVFDNIAKETAETKALQKAKDAKIQTTSTRFWVGSMTRFILLLGISMEVQNLL